MPVLDVSRRKTAMSLTRSPRDTTLVVLTVTAAAAVILAVGGAAAADPELSPSSASGAIGAPVTATSEPLVTPLAAAVIPGRIDVDRKDESNVVSARIEFAPGDATGWHSHPGAVLVQVASGALTLRHAAKGRCLTEVVRAGQGFFESPGAVHNAANHGADPAVVHATLVLPVGAPTDVSAPQPTACR